MLHMYFAGNPVFAPRFVCLLFECSHVHMFTLVLCFSLDGVTGALRVAIKAAFETLLKLTDAIIPPEYVAVEQATVG